MKTLRVYPTSINERYMQECAQALADGDIVLYPTDSHYALGCDATNQRAIERLCRIKGIDPKRNTLAITCADISQAAVYAQIDNRAFDVLRRNTPGPFTFILPPSPRLPRLFKGRREVGVRIPDNPIAVALAQALGCPVLTTTTATGPDAPDTVDAMADAYDNIAALMIDGGEVPGISTAVIDLTDSTDPTVVRQGPKELE